MKLWLFWTAGLLKFLLGTPGRVTSYSILFLAAKARFAEGINYVTAVICYFFATVFEFYISGKTSSLTRLACYRFTITFESPLHIVLAHIRGLITSLFPLRLVTFNRGIRVLRLRWVLPNVPAVSIVLAWTALVIAANVVRQHFLSLLLFLLSLFHHCQNIIELVLLFFNQLTCARRRPCLTSRRLIRSGPLNRF